jgi:hypothetical protein
VKDGRPHVTRPVQRRNADCSNQSIEIRCVVAPTGGVLTCREVSLDRVG